MDNELDCNFSNETFCKWRIDEERSFTKNWKFSEEGESPIKIDKIIKDGIELSDFGFLSLPYDPLSSIVLNFLIIYTDSLLIYVMT